MSRRLVVRVVGGVLAVVLLVALVSALGGGGSTRHLTAFFPRATGLYVDSSVRVLGVPIGKITRIDPEGDRVRVDMRYDSSYKLPDQAIASLVPPSIVSDRYIQISPAYTGGATLADHATIPMERTQVPVELDDIFGQLDQLAKALGPSGANAHGALSRVIDVGAANLRGNGQQLNTTLRGFSKAVQTLSNSRQDLFGTVSELQRFTSALASDDTGVRRVNQDLAAVSAQLAGERRDLGLALANLAVALGQVSSFVRDNRDAVTASLKGLTTTTSTILKEKRALIEVLDVAPLGLENLSLSYDPTTRTLRTRSSQEQGSNPGDPLNPVCQLYRRLGQQCPSGSPLPVPLVPSGTLGQLGSRVQGAARGDVARGAVASRGLDPLGPADPPVPMGSGPTAIEGLWAQGAAR